MPNGAKMKNLFAVATKEHHVLLDKLKRVVSNGNYHQDLIPKHMIIFPDQAAQNIVQVIDGIPSLCRIPLKDQTPPLVLRVSYKV
jgi:hypothetical protein